MLKESIIERFGKQGSVVVPVFEPEAKEKIVDFLAKIHEEDERNWASITTIAKGSGISAMYTRAVLQRLEEDKVVESARHQTDRKLYFRVKN